MSKIYKKGGGKITKETLNKRIKNKDIKKSIELGFLGFLTKQYYEKKKSVAKVRRRLKLELLGFFIFLSFSIYFLVFGYESLWFKFGMILCIVALTIATIKNLAVWSEIFYVQHERMKQYEELKRNKN